MMDVEEPRGGRPQLTPALVEELRGRVNPETGKRYTQTEIARMWGVSRQRVSQLKHELAHFARSPRERAMEVFPWRVEAAYKQSSLNKRLRDHLEYMATGGEGMDAEKLERLPAFWRMLREHDAVVEYHPAIPPSEKFGTGGWALRPRKREDGDLIIRVNDLAEMTELAYRLLRFPENPPE